MTTNSGPAALLDRLTAATNAHDLDALGKPSSKRSAEHRSWCPRSTA